MIRQLGLIADLNEQDKLALAGLPLRIKDIAENRDILREGDKPNECCLILDGLACRYKMVAGGRRQILSLHFPGDLPDLQSLHLESMDHSIGALTATRVAYIPHDAIRALMRANPRVADILMRYALIDASIFREWIANVGRRTAYERVAHVFCEVYTRMRALELAGEETFRLPMTQTELGDTTGLSTVHVNRVLQRLRREKLITSKGDVHAVADWERLREAADFDIGYLHMRTAPAP